VAVQPTLDVSDLTVEYVGSHRIVAVDGVSFRLPPGENLGVVGESGCGKSTLVRASIRLLPKSARIVAGSVRWGELDLVQATDTQLDRVRWREVALVPQASMNALNPVMRVGAQVREVLRVRGGLGRSDSVVRSKELCRLVGLDPSRLRNFPHQLSGGMRQRAVIAMALALEPRLLIADEATTGLDTIVQKRIMSKLHDLQQQQGFSAIYVSHDMSLIIENCHRIQVMYAGRIVEAGASSDVFRAPAHPYTMALRNAIPLIRGGHGTLTTISGGPPDLQHELVGCRFAPRCPFATELCRTEEPALRPTPSGLAACHYADRADEFRSRFDVRSA
jgi:peptide/nickel transport system ATP-binding protein